MLLKPKRVFTVHLAIIGLFALVNLLIGIGDLWGHHALFGFSRLLRLEEEANIPSTFSSLALAACGLAASAIRCHLSNDDLDRSSWKLLAGFFAFLALDEVAMIHELGNRISLVFKLSGVLHFFGVFLYIPILIWLGCRLFPFWLRQVPWLRISLFVGAIIYVIGAIGFEMVENELEDLGYDIYSMPMRTSFIFEECAEMFGVAVFLYAFLRHFSDLGGGQVVHLEIADSHKEGPPPVNTPRKLSIS